ncbi:TPA: hypothetical protein G8O67_003885 [Salmonella enterica]|uniref:Uncharacterized protein n=1 Tax=Salmonella enterica TaxID=28901 RepID=A0A756I311_SALER|nr:hypothetical protein [Salmonella enterica]
MGVILNIVIESKNGRIETAIVSGEKGKVTPEEACRVMKLVESIRGVLAASGDKVVHFQG